MAIRLLLTAACAAIAAISIPLIRRQIEPNDHFGFRTRRTLEDPEVWYPANAFAGWALLIAAVVSAFLVWLAPAAFMARDWAPVAVFMGPMGGALVACFLYLRRFG